MKIIRSTSCAVKVACGACSIPRIILIQLLDLRAVRTAFHYVYLSHDYIALCVFNSSLILANALFNLYITFSLIRLGNRCRAINTRMVSMLKLK